MSIDDATPEQWNKVTKSKTAYGKLHHPEDRHTDPVTKPDHYNKGGIEAIDYIKQQLGVGFASYCTGNVHKYLHRFHTSRFKHFEKQMRGQTSWQLKRRILRGDVS